MESRVCITGIGVISPVGAGVNSFWSGIKEKKSALVETELVDMPEFNGVKAGQIKEFQLSDYVKTKGLRYYSRAMGFAAAASCQALEDADYSMDDGKGESAGIILGSVYGNIESLRSFYQGALEDGPRYVNPMMFPRTMMTIPASQISINHKLKGINRTLSNGAACGMDSICYGAELIETGECTAVLAGGTEELSAVVLERQVLKNQSLEKTFPGEGSGMVLLENMEMASERKADIYSEITGLAHAFNCDGNAEEAVYETVKFCMECALKDASLRAEEVEAVFMQSIPGSVTYNAEMKAIQSVLGTKKDINTIQLFTGDCMAASSAMQICAGACMLREDRTKKTALCNAYTSDGAYTTVILKGMGR